ncbi:MAG: sigma-54-dependent transcriptional regulator [Wenzhouxiangellaceae bacterium]
MSASIPASILIVDDEPDIRELIGEILEDEGYRVLLAANAAEARQLRRQHGPDLVLLDVWMPDCDGISLLREWSEGDLPHCPVVMISGHASVEAAVEATRIGARDFIEKPVTMARLLNTVRKSLADERDPAPAGGARHADTSIPEPIGRSEAMLRLREQLEQAAQSQANVLIRGEPGSGRSTLARWLHARTGGAPGELVELVAGHAEQGLASLNQRLTDGMTIPATLVLDSLECLTDEESRQLSGLLMLAGQAIRVFSIAPAHIEQIVEDRPPGQVFHRLAEIRLDLPALRERREDIPDLIRAVAEQLPVRESLTYRAFPVAVQNLMRQHDWPGNLRELTNIVRALLHEAGDSEVGTDEVAALLERHREAASATHSALFELPLREAREAFERQYLIARLKRCQGSVGQLAEAVEMERTHLYRKLRQLGIDPRQVVEGE